MLRIDSKVVLSTSAGVALGTAVYKLTEYGIFKAVGIVSEYRKAKKEKDAKAQKKAA